MRYTQPLVGNQHIQTYLQKTIKNGTIANAQLWLGPEHVGKSTFLINYLLSLNCQQRTAEQTPCLKCQQCQSLQRDNYTNIIWLNAADKAVKFDAIKQARGSSLHSSLYQGVRALVIEQADRLHAAASNALLKLLEEPPVGLYLFLLSSDRERILPTIASRCLTLNFTSVAVVDLQAGFPQVSSQTIALAQGLPGQVQLFLAQPKSEAQRLKLLTTWVQIMQTEALSARLQLAQSWFNQDKSGQSGLQPVLSSLSLVLHDILTIQAQHVAQSPDLPYASELHVIAQRRTLAETVAALHKTQTLWHRQLTTPIQKKLALTNLLLAI